MDKEEVKQWLRIDGEDEDSTITMLMMAAESYLKNATGLPVTDDLSKLFCMVLISDWYENRELIGRSPSEEVRFTIQSIMTQLQHGAKYATYGVYSFDVHKEGFIKGGGD